MPRLHSFELVPDDAGRDAAIADWTALREAGLPSQLDHRGSTNTPHVTVLEAPALPADERARELLGPLLPVRARLHGLLVLGGERVTLARGVEIEDAVAADVLALRQGVPDLPHPGWLPHLTLARRLPRADLPRALEVLDPADREIVLPTLRRWDPDAGTVTRIG